jgi:uncharacterized protein (DUF1330 family)
MALMFLAVDSVTDEALFREYQAGALPVLNAYTHTVVAYDEAARPLERVDGPRRVIAVRFEDDESFHRFYDSPDYQAQIGKRLRSTDGFAVLVQIP